MKRFNDLSVLGPYASFQITGVDLALVNSVRRSILSDVQTAAFCFSPDSSNTVDILTNTSVLHNEFIGHRISLIPVHVNESETLDVSDGKSVYEFHLLVKNDGIIPIDVTSGDFTGTLNTVNIEPGDIQRFFPVDPVTRDHVLLMRLKPGSGGELQDAEEMEIRAQLRMGCGRDHARWTPTSLCAFGNQIDDAKAAAALEVEVEKSKTMNASEEEIARIIHDFNSMGRHRCFRVNEHGEAAEFNFKIRSECGLGPMYIFYKGIEILYRRLKDLAANIIGCKAADPAHPAIVTVDAYGTVAGMYQFSIEREDHTLGNLVQSFLFNKYIRDTKTTKELEYVGYYQPHPLENRIVLRVKVNGVDNVQAFMSSCIDAVAAEVHDVIAEFITFGALAGMRDVDALLAVEEIKIEA